MNLLFVVDHLSSGGAQGQMVLLALELTQRGHSVEFFVYQKESFREDSLRQAGIPIHRAIKRSRFSLAPIRELRNVIRGGNFDAMLSFLTTPNIYSTITRTGNEPRLVISERSSSNNPNHVSASYWKRTIARWLYRRADHICVNSHHLRKSLVAELRLPSDQVSTIWNGVDTNRFSMQPFPEGEFRFLSIGRIAEYKNARCLIEALAILNEQHSLNPKVNWLARRFPNLTPGEASHKRQLDELLEQKGLTKQWSWLPESASPQTVIADHHAVVHPSKVEGLPNVVCESLACGRPVRISRILDHPRMVADGKTGFLFDPANPIELADCMKRMLEAPLELRLAMGQQAHEFSEKELSKKQFVDQFEELFQKLITSQS